MTWQPKQDILRAVVGLVVLLAIWQSTVATGWLSSTAVPPPSAIVVASGELAASASFHVALAATVLAWLIALGIAVAIAIPVGLLLASLPLLRAATSWIVELLRPLPSVALAPLVTLLVGPGAEMKITVAALAAGWPVLLHTLRGVDEIEPGHRDTARAFRITPGYRVLGLLLPSMAPFLVTGIRLAASLALVVTVSVEFTSGGSPGVGQVVSTAGRSLARMDLVLAAVTITGVLAYLTNHALLLMQRRWLRWAPAGVTA